MEKRIVTHKWGNNPPLKDKKGKDIPGTGNDEYTFSNGFVIGQYGGTLSHYLRLVAEARKDFPKLKDAEISLDRVSHSTYMKHFILVRFSLPANTTHPKYTNWNRYDFDC